MKKSRCENLKISILAVDQIITEFLELIMEALFDE